MRRFLAAMLVAFAFILTAGGESARAQSPQLKFIAALDSIDTPEGTHVTITSDAPLSDCAAFQHGDRFYVLIPQATAPSVGNNLKGRAFTSAHLEGRGRDLVLSFGLQSGTTARLDRKFNRLELFFKTPEGSNPAAINNTTPVAQSPEAAPSAGLSATDFMSHSPLPSRVSFDLAIEPDVGDYEGRLVADVEVVLEGTPRDAAAEAEFLSLLRVAPNTEYSAVRVRESLQALFDSGRVVSGRVEVSETAAGAGTGRAGSPLRVRFIVRLQVRVAEVLLDLGVLPPGTPISEDELRARLNMLEPGTALTEQKLRNNADLIQAYLRDRGFFRAEVDFTQQVDTSGTRAAVTFRVRPGEQARVAAFNIRVQGFDATRVFGGQRAGGNGRELDGSLAATHAFAVDFFLQLDNAPDQLFGARRAAGHINIDGHDAINALHNRVIVENAAATGARAHRNDPFRLGHLVVNLAQDGRHLLRNAACDDHHIGLARAGTKHFRAKARNVIFGANGCHHFDGAAGEAKS
jgi:hypothetical protein